MTDTTPTVDWGDLNSVKAELARLERLDRDQEIANDLWATTQQGRRVREQIGRLRRAVRLLERQP